MMTLQDILSFCRSRKWTLGLCLALGLLNVGLFSGAPVVAHRVVELAQYDRGAIAGGEVWRLLSGNLVHWSSEHFLLDVGAFALVGILYERRLGAWYPWLLFGSSLAVGGSLFLLLPDLETYRGLSGVDSGQFLAALAVESIFCYRQNVKNILWVAPAAGLFLTKIAYEATTGQMFFGTESLGELGTPIPLAHIAGVAACTAGIVIWFYRENLAIATR